MKGAPPDMDVQRWNANKGKLLQDLDDAGRLWSWESLSEDGKKILGGGGGADMEVQRWNPNMENLLKIWKRIALKRGEGGAGMEVQRWNANHQKI